jgi:hypothetical protein
MDDDRELDQQPPTKIVVVGPDGVAVETDAPDLGAGRSPRWSRSQPR